MVMMVMVARGDGGDGGSSVGRGSERLCRGNRIAPDCYRGRRAARFSFLFTFLHQRAFQPERYGT